MSASETTTTACATKPAPFDLTAEQVSDFHRDGVMVVRGLLRGRVLEDAIRAVQATVSSGIGGNLYRNVKVQSYRTSEALKRVAFESAAPTICAKLMGLDSDEDGGGRSLRLLKDGVFALGRGDKGCGWHVDDKFFWPCEDSHNDSESQSQHQDETENDREDEKKTECDAHEPRRDAGINVWITLSPVTATEGGGLAVAPGSHDITGRGGIGRLTQNARRTIASGGAQTTCGLENLAPECHDELEAIKRVYDLAPGDAILHDRYVFHRADPMKGSDNDNDNDNGNDDEDERKKFRISLRYMPSDATFFDTGFGIDQGLKDKNMATGDPLWKAGECFPRVWPSTLEEEVRALAA